MTQTESIVVLWSIILTVTAAEPNQRSAQNGAKLTAVYSPTNRYALHARALASPIEHTRRLYASGPTAQ